MKKIKRTTIKIKQRELIIVSRRETNGEEAFEICPFCKVPAISQKSLTGQADTAGESSANNAITLIKKNFKEQ